jgi:epoxyqueuosine reductase
MTNFTQVIRQKAYDLGFDPVGMAPADPLEGAQFYARWVAHGYAGEMSYLERNLDKRADPRLMVPEARSVICLGMNYFQQTPPAAPLRGRIAAYAQGDDYHDLVKKRLFSLWEFIQENATIPVQGRVYVDTAPVLERELAQRAGLGWWGKNTCLINKWRGSHFFLGEIILDLPLDYDEPATDHCGSCSRCLDACPTEAFPEPYVLDARRCISYLNIELKGPIPHELRPDMGAWIFGCDVCQDVCPWNGKAVVSQEPAFAARPGLEAPELIRLLGLDREAFNLQFRRHPAKRAKRCGVLRNVAVALGNGGDQRAVLPLLRALADEEPLVRGHVAWALGRLGGDLAKAGLEEALAHETDEYVKEEVVAALAALDDAEGKKT